MPVRSTTTDPEVSYFTAANARYSSPSQVAQTFVPPEVFARLIQPENSVLVGPRGSGKTSMLKMLQAEALEAWAHPEAESYVERVSFVGVLVPADPAWHSQLHAIGETGAVDAADATALGDAAFTTHVLHSLVRAMRSRLTTAERTGQLRQVRRTYLTPEREAELVSELSEPWHVAPRTRSLASLDYALNARTARIGQAARGAFNDDDRRYLYMDFMAASTLAVDLFNEFVNEPAQRWAFLFDELEVAPEDLRAKLVRMFRLGNPRLFLKLSLFPYTPQLSITDVARDPLPGQDYEYINLATPRISGRQSFMEELATTVLRARGVNRRATEYLGPSYFSAPTVFEEEADHIDSVHEIGGLARREDLRNLLIALGERDVDFRAYLQRSGIDPTNITIKTGSDSERAAKAFRKVKNQAIVRSRFGGVERRQSRRSYALYTGVPSVYHVNESNPRYLIIFLRALIDAGPGRRASRLAQSRALQKVQSYYLDLLRTVPEVRTPESEYSYPSTVLGLVDSLGKALQHITLDQAFDADAVGAFFVREDSAPALKAVIESAINVGAIIRLPDPDQEYSPFVDLIDQRLRLSFLLAPRFHLAVRVGRAVRVETLLTFDLQPTLFRPDGFETEQEGY